MFKKANEAAAAATVAAPETEIPVAKGTSVLGPTLTFKGGELSFDEDLIIEGTVEGTIAHKSHHLTVGKHGRVKADVRARVITVYGTVEGDLHGDEAVQITATARVTGNVFAPRVAVESGASFNGSIKTKDVSPAGERAVAAEAPSIKKRAVAAGAAARREEVAACAEAAECG